MRISRILQVACITLCLPCTRLCGATNGVDIGYSPTVPDLNPSYMRHLSWQQVASLKLADSGYNVMFDRFGPFSEFEWLWRSQNSGRQLLEDYNSAGMSTSKKMLTYTLRETAVTTFLPERGNGAQKFLAGSIGNTVEEEVSIARSTYSAAESAWWDDGHAPYGIRPWSTNPYLYYRLRLSIHRLPLLLAETRIKYNIFSSTHEILEENVSLPLLHGWSFNVGGAVYPTTLRSAREDRYAYSVQLVKVFGKHTSNGAFSVGAYMNTRTTIVTMGLFLPW